jgi:hypothetical protein
MLQDRAIIISVDWLLETDVLEELITFTYSEAELGLL